MNELATKAIIMAQRAVSALQGRASHAQRGQALVEYVLVLALIALAVVVAMKLLQPAIAHTFNQTACTLNTAGTPTPTPCP